MFFIISVSVACNRTREDATPLQMAKTGLRHIQADFVKALSPESWTTEENADVVESCTISINGISRSGIYMQAPGICRFNIFVHRGAVFTTWVAMTPKAWNGSSDGVLFTVSATSTDPPDTVLLSRLRLDPMNIPLHRNWFRLDGSLAPWTGKVVSLELRSSPGDAGDSFQDWCVWGEPTVHSPPLSYGMVTLESVSEEIGLGEQQLDLSFVATRVLGSPATPGHHAQPLMTTSLELNHLKREGLYAHPPWAVSRLVTIGPRPKMVTSLGLIEKCWTSSNGVDFGIEIERPDASPSVLFEYWLCPQVNACDRGWVDIAIDLSRFVGETVKITLTTRGGYRGNLTCDSAAWANPIVVSTP